MSIDENVSPDYGGRTGYPIHPLTRDRAKPAVPFGGKYRIVDFRPFELVNSQIYSIYLLVQFRSQSLIEHLKDGWQFGRILHDHFIVPVPAQMRLGDSWYQGTADAIFQNLNLIDDFKPDLIAVFGADHIYRMDIQQMIEFHVDRKAAVTVATLPVALKSPISLVWSTSILGCAYSGSTKSRKTRARCRGRRVNAWPRWVTICSIRKCCELP